MYQTYTLSQKERVIRLDIEYRFKIPAAVHMCTLKMSFFDFVVGNAYCANANDHSCKLSKWTHSEAWIIHLFMFCLRNQTSNQYSQEVLRTWQWMFTFPFCRFQMSMVLAIFHYLGISQDYLKEKKYGKYMLHLKWEVSMYHVLLDMLFCDFLNFSGIHLNSLLSFP